MEAETYYELRNAIVETFYEVLLAEGYTIGQAAGRCLVEFRRETQSGGRQGLIALSVLLARVARHEPAALARFQPEVRALAAVAKQSACWRGLASGEKSRLKEDVRFVAEKAAAFSG